MYFFSDWERKFSEEGFRVAAPTYPDHRLQSAVKNHLGLMAFNYHTGRCLARDIPGWLVATVDKIKKEHFDHCQEMVVGDWIEVHYKLLSGDFYEFVENKSSILRDVIAEAVNVTNGFRDFMGIEAINLSQTDIWESIYDSHLSRLYCNLLHRAMVKNSRSRSTLLSTYKTLKCYFIISRELCLVHDLCEGKSFYLDFDSVLLLSDLWTQRNLVLISACLLTKALPTIYTCGELYWLSIFKWGDELLRRYGNSSFKYIKMFEAICIGELLRRDDRHSLSEPFIESTHSDFIADDPLFLQQHLQSLLTTLNSASIEMLSETFGLYRLWGHPTVDERAGCVKIKAVGKKHIVPSPHILKMINACITREFCLNYISREGKWPNILITNSHNPLFKIYEMRKLKWRGMYDHDQLEWWHEVTMRKNFEFDTCVDYSQLIDDKAISCYKDHWDFVYDRSPLGYTPPKPSESRRVVMEVIRREELDVNDILYVIQRRQVPDNWKVIGLHSKEREIKIEPRMFIMMVLEMRLYFCVTEMNIANQVFKYFPQQTMTCDETTLTNRLLSLTNRRATPSKRHVQVVINIDFEKWNLQWRIDTTKYTFTFLDSLFGRPGLYTYSHQFFKESMFYLVSRFNPPDGVTIFNRLSPPESDMLWYDDESGKEGIRQKGWTLITIGALLYVESITGITGVITGQGDNQVIVASFPTDDLDRFDITLKSRVSSYVNVLTDVFRRIGLPIKTEESWCSTSLFAYGKDLIHNGAYLPMVIKKLARVMPDTNDLLPTLTNSLSTIFSSGYAACCKGYEVSVPYCISFIEGYLYLLSYCKYSLVSNGKGFSKKIEMLVRNDKHFVRFLLTIPHSLAGYSTMSMIDFVSRGHSDPVTAGITAIRALTNIDPIYSQFLHYLNTSPQFSTHQDYAFLIMDPTCINWKKPTPCTYIIKQYVEEQLSVFCNNKDFRQLFHSRSRDEDQDLITTLMEIRPVAPRVLNEIYRHSPSGARAGILATVSNVRTIKAIAQRSNEHSIFSRVQKFEEDFSEHLFNLFLTVKRLPVINYDLCTTELADRLRVQSWFPSGGIERLEGVTMPHPLEQFRLTSYESRMMNEPCIFYIVDNPSFDAMLTTSGKIKPYIGNLTRERKISRLLNLPVKDPPLKSALRLQTLSDYITSPNDHLYHLLDQIIMTRTSLPLGLLRFASDRILTGSRTHRLQDVSTKHGGLINVRPNANSHIYISSDKIGKVDFTDENLNINFQVTILTHLYIIPYHCLLSPVSRTFVARLSCNHCTQSINEPLMTLDNEISLKYGDYSQCRFLFSDGSVLPIDVVTSSNGTVLPVDVSQLSTKELLWTICYQLSIQAVIITTRSSRAPSNGSEAASRAVPNLIGIGEIMSLGFVELTLALAHVQFLYYILSYYNARIPRNGITIESLIELSIESARYDLYQPLCEAYPILNIRRDVFSKVNVVEPPDYGENASSNLSVIKQIIRLRLLKHIRSLGTLPPIQCYTRQEWCTVICLNLIHRLIKQEIIMNPGLSLITGVYCLRYRHITHDLPSIYNGDELTNELLNISGDLDHLPRHLVEDFPTQMITLDDLIRRPILRASQSVEYSIHAMNSRCGSSGRTQQRCEKVRSERVSEVDPFRSVRYLDVLSSVSEEMVVGEVALPNNCPGAYPDVNLSFVRHKRIFSKKHTFFTPDGSTAAHYKYISILNYLGVRPSRCITLADGAGTVTRMLVKAYGAKVFYNSLLDLSDYIQHRYVHYVPVEFDDEVVNNLIRYDLTLFNHNDLRDDTTIQTMVTELSKEGKFDLITCDLESRDYNLSLVNPVSLNVCKIARALLAEGGLVIFKIYLESLDCAYRIVQNLRLHFMHHWLLISKYSNHETSEVFVVCTQLTRQNELMLGDSVEPLRDGVDAQIIISTLARLLDTRTSSTLPYWVCAPQCWVKTTKILRHLEARDTSSRSLLMLSGSEPSVDEDLVTWLTHRIEYLQLGISLAIESLDDERQLGFRVSSITQLISQSDETILTIKRQILYCLHCALICRLIPLISTTTNIHVIFNFVDQFVSSTHEIRDEFGHIVWRYNIKRELYSWERRFGQHLYRYLGHLYLEYH